jgi:hypothetical protein
MEMLAVGPINAGHLVAADDRGFDLAGIQIPNQILGTWCLARMRAKKPSQIPSDQV